MDFTLNPVQLLFQLIDAANGTTTDPDHFMVSVPSDTDTKEGFNAKVTITALAEAGMVGSQTFNYQRIDMAQAVVVKGADISIGADDTVVQLLAAINTHFGTAFTEEELGLTDVVIPAAGTTGVVAITVDPEHLVFFGTANLNVTVADIEVADVFTVTDLDGFTYEA